MTAPKRKSTQLVLLLGVAAVVAEVVYALGDYPQLEGNAFRLWVLVAIGVVIYRWAWPSDRQSER